MLYYVATQNQKCITYLDQSIYVDYPYVKIYNTSDCSTKALVNTQTYTVGCPSSPLGLGAVDASQDVSSPFDNGVQPSFSYKSSELLTTQGGPTPKPTLPPISAPTGWVYSYINPGTTCEASPPFARGFATGTCLPATANTAVMYSCTGSK
jgi:hypothetical protein